MESITRIMILEHDSIMDKLGSLSEALTCGDRRGILEFVRFFQEDMDLHGRKEEEVLYPEASTLSPSNRNLVKALLEEHAELRSLVENMKWELKSSDQSGLLKAGQRILVMLPAHIRNEELLLFPSAELLMDGWARTRVLNGFNAIGSWVNVKDERPVFNSQMAMQLEGEEKPRKGVG